MPSLVLVSFLGIDSSSGGRFAVFVSRDAILYASTISILETHFLDIEFRFKTAGFEK